jgi:hypothetical protein
VGWVAAEAEHPRRQFWLMLRMHSEELAVKDELLPLFERFSDPRNADFARRHRDVIVRFQRFPHRYALLARVARAAAATAARATEPLVSAFVALPAWARCASTNASRACGYSKGGLSSISVVVRAPRWEFWALA